MGKFVELKHPLIKHKISLLRDRKTGTRDFRDLVKELSMLMAYEVTGDLPLKEIEIETPVAKAKTQVISGKTLAIVPILRAGLGMVEGMISLIPSAKVGHVGVYRDPDTLKPVEYYFKMPEDIAQRDVIVVDPMLATGGSACACIELLKGVKAKSIKFVCLIAAPEGVAELRKQHPDVDIYAGALDQKLNDHAYIVPGLGDAGDRLFGTK